MKAICLQSPGDIRVAQIPDPEQKQDRIIIKAKSVGICGSDIGAYRGVNPLVSYPRIIGHEIAGEVVGIPADEKTFSVGDRVILEPYVYCGHCYPCSIGHTNCCENLTVLGVHIDGGMSEYFSHPRQLIHKVPDNIPWAHVPMAEPLGISMHAVNRPQLQQGEHVVITGSGPIGLLAAQMALTMGAIPIMVDLVEERLAFARSLGVEHTVNLAAVDAVEAIKQITGGRMAEVVVEASGSEKAIRSAIDYVSYAGRISLVGWPKNEVALPTALFTKKELTIVGSRNAVGTFPACLQLIADKKVNVEPIITKVVSFDEIPAAVKELSEHPEKYLKVIGMF
ncbi:alcohol dehydrogenase [Anaerosporomusa subterranea]|uniref:Alcohol dehydrogenase n=2 Tax=Anaerosporomusa subterranea TaxID=1794912 RepID=A0A154BPS3_ANASB|nr:alcohol dehydrogenase [Anaerosporomusa subterranea]